MQNSLYYFSALHSSWLPVTFRINLNPEYDIQIWPLLAFQPQLPMLPFACLPTLSHITVPFNSFIFSQTAFRVYLTAFLASGLFLHCNTSSVLPSYHSSYMSLHVISSEKLHLLPLFVTRSYHVTFFLSQYSS